jgi:mannosyl-3-phosphoglycerate phosphatase
MFLCFTDLNGTLLNHHDYRYEAALPTLKKMQAAGIPIIPTTSKTKAEVLDFRLALGLTDPFVVENGSGIFLLPTDQRFDFQELAIAESLVLTEIDGLQTVILGAEYDQIRKILGELSTECGEVLQGFCDLSPTALQELTSLSPEAVKLASDRQFSEPFIEPEFCVKQLAAIAQTKNCHILVGNRFCHLLGAGAGKGRAAKLLTKAWQAAHRDQPDMQQVKTIGLGDSPNDLSLLAAVDIPIVIPGDHGAHPELRPYIQQNGWQVAPEPGCLGWSMVMEQTIAQMH